ncbi:PH domain-containing protein [Haloarcula onubensis]|uniref:PH domain-containing protein n=1 Tax=Haloarcula onubensis TaxID=2950539 RepID=A0ABU2FJU2_9EURY|nr:PH domain-containing protein [Halomicroarcula sp. S3CR25-11]MDS0280562.1 PH domain-containing protein [Halomicroarcula sp. S3CR25-11]
MPQGSYVTDKTIGKVEDEVRADEEVQFIARGNDVEVSYRGSTDNLNYIRGRPRLVVTDQRVFLKIPKTIGTNVESFEYDEIAGADLGNSGLTGTRVKFRTVQGKDYSFRADKPDDSELEMMVEFMREQASGERPQTSGSAGSTPADFHQTESCIECGEGVNEGVSRCPNCGYDPSDYKSKQRKNSLIGGILCATIIGIPLGILYIRRARKQGKKAKRGVTG